MSARGQASVALTISRETMVTSDVTALLGMAPTTTEQPDPRVSGNALPARWELVAWEGETGALGARVREFTARLAEVREQLHRLHREGYGVEIGVSFDVADSETVRLDVDVLSGVSELGLPVSFTTRHESSGESVEDFFAGL